MPAAAPLTLATPASAHALKTQDVRAIAAPSRVVEYRFRVESKLGVRIAKRFVGHSTLALAPTTES